MLCAIGIFVYTVSYGIWEWKNRNKSGALFVYMLALFEMGLSVYTVLQY